ncbi:MAG: hypothetical protein A2821_02950 [Candidatus Magasanikbacteria bacterium RIFCSPHIGHO2_01_FULL_41_23]|uniref:Glycosyltransferase subfamily 4-like N-terminal domain-containing protein n=1 Tax=Candidatus Magasanikbacteria bacterium RIFCSPLOWO2_01_FULL_40_15 TaxID=1798686 RepID=A0A1F6N4A6_9BACT|nr:MAG: hypothetical protein A2821_02950 [Candidatus Magasanikbacteria bacterium RIFCSPHIGHO2_01_FULL_41_23]OGH67296.1 MAG: hypothetical protein A3C66_00965 [Candidatus Magasanikbacteria bacterium RIFCSPHIGHO2_02_FULL_41_35]OGH76521.1 MAG: hypothetical protein A3F22_00175 [Candidatus Magasanikbacteria bacterium RIFCSPHIGHO2_12_FULL_41_16]OGH78493.1 MAG: hypothetical protein A2983_03180 [Candidatus Magasanikbacteria bacterium RIFCSPLOWO2_01_FULL_40_15]
MENKGKILIVTPRFPIPTAGACEQDRLEGIKQLKRLGYDIRVIGKIFDFQDKSKIESFSKEFGIHVETVPYIYTRKRDHLEKIRYYIKRFLWPPYWDGAAAEFTEPNIRRVVRESLQTFKPDVVWFDYTYLWPLYKEIKQKNIPIITRSINFEPRHFLEEDGLSLINLIRCLPKFISEILVARRSDCIVALNPNEAKIYAALGAKQVFVLPLRKLPALIGKNTDIKDNHPLHVLYMSSSYTVAHNQRALRLLLNKIIPIIHQKYPNQFVFHFSGSKLPPSLFTFIDGKTVKYEGYIPIDQMESFLARIDIVVSPSSKKVGMQQKVFEPLVRGIPLVTSPCNIVGYPFYHEESVLLAVTPDQYVDALQKLRDYDLRKKLSKNAVDIATTLFSREIVDSTGQSIIDSTKKLD